MVEEELLVEVDAAEEVAVAETEPVMLDEPEPEAVCVGTGVLDIDTGHEQPQPQQHDLTVPQQQLPQGSQPPPRGQ